MIAPEITIDAEFADLIPPLHADERIELEKSLVDSGGPRDPLVVWDRGDGPPVLLDGHNRHEICTRLGLPFSITAIELPGKDEARQWIERNQIGRRNLTREQFAIILGRLYNQSTWRPGKNGEARPGGKVRDRFAEQHGVNPSTIDRAGRFQRAAKKLGIESEIAAGKMKASAERVMAAAKMVPDNPTREQVDEALQSVGVRPFPKERLAAWQTREPQGWLVPAEPTDCLKAIRFYATSFVMQAPESVAALNNMLIGIVQENKCRVA
jgi:hypothetical protein